MNRPKPPLDRLTLVHRPEADEDEAQFRPLA